MTDRPLRVAMLALAVGGLIALHAPQESLQVVVIRTVLVVILALTLIPKGTP